MKITTSYNEKTGVEEYYWGQKSYDENLSDYENYKANFERANPHLKTIKKIEF